MESDGVGAADSGGNDSTGGDNSSDISDEARDSLDGGGASDESGSDGSDNDSASASSDGGSDDSSDDGGSDPSGDSSDDDNDDENQSDDSSDDASNEAANAAANEPSHGYDEVGTDVPAEDSDPNEPTTAEREATQERMEAEAKSAKDAFEATQEAEAYADALDQEVQAQNVVAAAAADVETPLDETAAPGTFADSYVSQGLSGVNEGIANVLGGPVDLVEMGLNGIMSAAEFMGVPESVTPEFEGSFLGSDHIKDMMTDMGSIAPESADPNKQTVRDGAEMATEVVSAVIGGGLASQGRNVAQQADEVLDIDVPNAVDLDLKYKDGWTDAQRAAADEKVQALTEADTVVTPSVRSGTSASSRYTREVGPVPQGMDVDHVQDLQLGGADEVFNMSPLDASVNRSLGSQIQHQIKDLDVGTPVGTVTIGDR